MMSFPLLLILTCFTVCETRRRFPANMNNTFSYSHLKPNSIELLHEKRCFPLFFNLLCFSFMKNSFFYLLLYAPCTSLTAPSHTQTHCHHTSSPQAPSLKGSDLSALPVRSSLFKEFQAATLSLTHTHAHTMSSSSSCIYLFFSSSYLWEIKSISLGGWSGGTSNSAAQARSAPDWESRKGDIYHSNTHRHYRHAPCSLSHSPFNLPRSLPSCSSSSGSSQLGFRLFFHLIRN